MRRWNQIHALGICLAFLSASGTAGAEMKQIQTARLHSQVHIDASQAATWSYMTRGANFVNWMPMWSRPRNAKVNLLRVGDWLDFVDEWNNRGRSVVTFVARNKEIRLANEPLDGSFICQVKMMLEPEARGTLVHLYEQYTDESPATDFNATAQKVQAAMDRALQSLKTEVEARKRS
jgi:hypothetical protein